MIVIVQTPGSRVGSPTAEGEVKGGGGCVCCLIE